MKQAVQNVGSGELSIAEVPAPMVRPGHVLIANAFSLISSGTERTARELATKSLLGKARARPDQVRRVLEKVRTDGLAATRRQVSERLDEPMTLGYSSAGVVLACGDGVETFRPGERVASNGSHSEVVCVPRHLCARIPDAVPTDQAAFTVLGAVAMHAVRLSGLALGETALVVGLGLVGQLTVALARAAGCRVLGTDPNPDRCRLAVEMGADDARPGFSADEVAAVTGGLGADAVLIAAATASNQPMELAMAAVRQKGRVVLVGEAGLQLDRRSLFDKEAELVVSRSYGPGRYDPSYEEQGHDYPAAYVRWTEQRNMQAVLELMRSERLDVGPLISHRFPLDDALKAYDLIERGSEPHLGVMIQYAGTPPGGFAGRIELAAQPLDGEIGVGVLGAGDFARSTLLPLIQAQPELAPRVLCSASGTSAAHHAGKLGFLAAVTDEDEVLGDPAVSAVFVITRHDQHARQVVEALQAGKHVFVEKPLCLTFDELTEIGNALAEARPTPLLTVGFNRRFSPAAIRVREVFAGVDSPLTVSIRINAGSIPEDHWTQRSAVGGGRIVGEACHALDLATFLTGAPPTRVFAESVGGDAAPAIRDDQCFITLRHTNGSVSNIAYLAGGDRAFPKERVEVIGGGRVAVIDDFRSVTIVVEGKRDTGRRRGQDKGHRDEIAAFARALSDGGAATIPWSDIHAVTTASLLAVRSLREGVPFDVPPFENAP